MEIGNVTGTASNLGRVTSGYDMGKEDFLNLMVAQLKNQDPLNPQDSTEFTAQLAQYSSLEQLINLGEKMDESIDADLALAQTVSNTLAADLLGKEATIIGNALQHTTGESQDVHFRIGDFADTVRITIYDPAGNEVRTIEQHAVSAGKQSIEWDGKNNAGKDLPPGIYRFDIEAVGTDQENMSVLPLMIGRIDSIRYEGLDAILMVNGIDVSFTDVLELGMGDGGEG
ncbi:MAG TPA: flagellar hook capping FlgD N-terminal domain-containing protein [Calditrichia bacterium]|nr:flagellar hook capping protein [Calditrichota bacterium]HQV34026.1 flagellar hook capping FlgD N-terminal domain-containing protein [Calditrichia bacterium]